MAGVSRWTFKGMRAGQRCLPFLPRKFLMEGADIQTGCKTLTLRYAFGCVWAYRFVNKQCSSVASTSFREDK